MLTYAGVLVWSNIDGLCRAPASFYIIYIV